MIRFWMLALIVALSGSALGVCHGQAVQFDNVLLTLIEQIDLPAREAGSLARLSVREGDVVERGKEVAALDDDEARLAVVKSEHELAIARTKAENEIPVHFARKAHEVASAEYRRALESVEKFHKSVSETELDQLRLTAEKAKLQIQQAEQEQEIARLTVNQKQAELEAAKLKLEHRRVVAPLSGMVVQIKKHCGEWLSPGDTVLRIVRLDRLRIEAFVPARDITADLQGRQVNVTVDLPGQGPTRFDGTVVFVSPEVNPVNGQVLVWAEIDNKELRLRPGQAAGLVIASGPVRKADNRRNIR